MCHCFCPLKKVSVFWKKLLFHEESFCFLKKLSVSGKKPSDLRRNWHVLFKNCTCYQCFCIVTLTQIHPSSPECLLLFMTGHFFRNHFVTGHVEWITCGKLAVQVTMEILCNLSDTRKFFDFELLHCDQWCRRQWQKQQHLAKTTMTTLFTRQKTAVAVFTKWTQTRQKKTFQVDFLIPFEIHAKNTQHKWHQHFRNISMELSDPGLNFWKRWLAHFTSTDSGPILACAIHPGHNGPCPHDQDLCARPGAVLLVLHLVNYLEHNDNNNNNKHAADHDDEKDDN